MMPKLGLSNSTVGLGGCKVHQTTFDCCEYNLTVFDDLIQKMVNSVNNPQKGPQAPIK